MISRVQAEVWKLIQSVDRAFIGWFLAWLWTAEEGQFASWLEHISPVWTVRGSPVPVSLRSFSICPSSIKWVGRWIKAGGKLRWWSNLWEAYSEAPGMGQASALVHPQFIYLQWIDYVIFQLVNLFIAAPSADQHWLPPTFPMSCIPLLLLSTLEFYQAVECVINEANSIFRQFMETSNAHRDSIKVWRFGNLTYINAMATVTFAGSFGSMENRHLRPLGP